MVKPETLIYAHERGIMAKTISTHNGSVAHRGHNVRDKWAINGQEHIDLSLSGNNLILCDEKPREAYKRLFGEALKNYNDKQDRPERRIKDYYSHIEKDAKKHTVYEMIVQIGDRKDTGLDAPTERECLVQFYSEWRLRNPNLECIGAYLHADEKDGTIHMHIDYIPVAHGYKRGMEMQTGLVRALGEMGFKKQGKETAQILWERRENAALENICREHGIEVKHIENNQKQHLSKEMYIAQQERDNAIANAEAVKEEERKAKKRLNNLIRRTDKAKKKLDKLTADIRELDSIKGLFEDIIADDDQRAAVADQRAATAERRAIEAEQQAIAAEQRATTAEQQAIAAEQKAAAVKQQAVAAEQRVVAAERRAAGADATYKKLKSQIMQDKMREELNYLKAKIDIMRSHSPNDEWKRIECLAEIQLLVERRQYNDYEFDDEYNADEVEHDQYRGQYREEEEWER